MPEPRETHAAIDARRNARGGGEREALARLLAREFGAFLAHDPDKPDVFWGGAADVILAAGWVPIREVDKVVAVSVDRIVDLVAERDALAATVERVIALAAKWTAVGPEYVALPDATAQLRAALALAPSDPATDTGGEGDG